MTSHLVVSLAAHTLFFFDIRTGKSPNVKEKKQSGQRDYLVVLKVIIHSFAQDSTLDKSFVAKV